MKKSIIMILLLFFSVHLYGGTADKETALGLFNRGKILMYQGKSKEAMELLINAETYDPSNMVVKIHIARLLSWLNKWPEAILKYKEVRKKSNKKEEVYWRALFGEAQVLSWQKNYNPALKKYRSILKNYSKISSSFKRDIHIAIGDIISWEKEYGKAIRYFTNTLKSYPNDVILLNRIAKIYFWDENYPKAKLYANKTLSIEKDNVYANNLKLTIGKIKKFSIGVGYLYTFYTSQNSNGEYVQNHTSHVDFSWKVIDPLTLYFVVDVPVQNYIESANSAITSLWNVDINIRFALAWRITRKMYLSWGIDYTILANILPDLNTDIGYSVKLSDRFDFLIGYKFTWDQLDSAQIVGDKFYHQFSPGLIFYITRDIYLRFKIDLVTDFSDFSFAVLLHQSFIIDPKNSIQVYLFYGSGRSYLYYSDATISRDTNNVAASVVYAHYFTPAIGLETMISYTNSINSYQSVSVGMRGIFKF